MDVRDYLRISSALLAYELRGLFRRRVELILSPMLSWAIAMVITPLGLTLYGSSIGLEKVVITGMIIEGAISGAAVATLYFLGEMSFEAIDRVLQVPLPLWAALLCRSLVSATGGLMVSAFIWLLSLPYLGFSPESLSAVVLASYVASLGIIGVVSLAGYWVRSIQKLSIAASFASAALTYLSPLYFPLDALPMHIRVIMILNPPSLAIELVRKAVVSAALRMDTAALMLAVNLVWFFLGLLALLKKAERR
ncbi:MAG: ABC transporter permease [Thermofilum sp.]|jgi:ABC-2 type transport system permease protein|nr:ABC transporter permease [Thermofilum sp.]MCC6065781.1 ABC transporter permease [Thermofilum sp.]